MNKLFMPVLTLLYQKPYQNDFMSLNTPDKYTVGDIGPIAFSIWQTEPDILFGWEGNCCCRGRCYSADDYLY